MRKETSLCMGCMAAIENAGGDAGGGPKICALCGYTESGVFLSSYLAPTTFLADRYIIGKLISYNGEGAYYIAYDVLNNAKVTVREYMPDTLCGRQKQAEAIEVNPQFVALYKTYLSEFIELNRALMIKGQNLQIQRVLDVFTENNTAYAVYEYIAGVSLKSYLSNLGGVLPWEQVRELFTPLFSTLGVVHSAGIIHRGISPSTILLNDRSELILINFEITAVRTFGSEINYEVFEGYAAPEQYCGRERHGSCTDVYGMAATLYKVLTGQMPAGALSRKENDGITEPALINRNIPQSVSAAIMKGLTLDVNERTQEISKFINGLFEAGTVSLPDTTDEILIKKPPRIAEPDEARNGAYGFSQGSRAAMPYRRRSYVLPVAGLVLLFVLVTAIIAVMINPDLVSGLISADTPNTARTTDNNNIAPIPNTTPPQTPVTNPPTPPQVNTELYRIPDFTTRRFDSLESNNIYSFLKFNPVYEFNDNYNEGVVFEQDVPPDSVVAAGSEIILKVSKGPATAPLPAFEGVSFADYERLLNDAKIKHGGHTGEYHDEIEEGFVIRCVAEDRELNAGDIIDIAEGETVTVYFSLGPEFPEFPDDPNENPDNSDNPENPDNNDDPDNPDNNGGDNNIGNGDTDWWSQHGWFA